MLKKHSGAPGPALLEKVNQHQQSQQSAVPGPLPALDPGSTLHCAGPGCDTHQGPLVPQATSCPRPMLGYWTEAGR